LFWSFNAMGSASVRTQNLQIENLPVTPSVDNLKKFRPTLAKLDGSATKKDQINANSTSEA